MNLSKNLIQNDGITIELHFSSKYLLVYYLVNVENSENLIQLGKKHLRDGNYQDALSFFDQALSLEPANPDLWNFKGITLRSLGRYDEASECYNRSLEIEPRDKESS